jgi:hypothetical protein
LGYSFSAIDFVVTSKNVENWIQNMLIDEEGLAKIRGRNKTDHNTIIIDLNISNIDKTLKVKRTTWNMKAPPEKWAEYTDELNKGITKATESLKETTQPISLRYKKWLNHVEQAAWKTIGKTTIKDGGKENFSGDVKEMRKLKKPLKEKISAEKNCQTKQSLIEEYKILQSRLHDMIVEEKTTKIQQRFEKILADKSRTTFWKEKRAMT